MPRCCALQSRDKADALPLLPPHPTGETLLNDVLPMHVAQSLKNLISSRGTTPANSPRFPAAHRSGSNGDSLGDLSITTPDSSVPILKLPIPLRCVPGSTPDAVPEDGCHHDGGQPVALGYQQWHPSVTILFADIVGFTTLSNEVEPELVMLMLHGEHF